MRLAAASNASFGNDGAVNQHDWDSEVVQTMRLVVGVDIDELGVEAEVAEEAQGFIAEVAALSGHQNDLHEAEPSLPKPAAAESPLH